MASAENVTVPFFKKKGRGRPATSRKRSASPPATAASSHLAAPSSSSTKSEVVLPARKAAGNLLSAGTKRTVSQREDDDGSGEERDGPDVKWTAAGSHSAAAREIIAGDEAAEVLAKRRRSERRAAGLPEGEDGEGEGPDDGLYRGQKAYASHVRKSKEVPKAMRVGPQRASGSTIRTVTIVDYQPDVCKDYKETGYCGYGDTCKFLHDRGTYLAGWQLDKLAAEPKKNAGGDESGSDSDDEDIPFACLICRKPYTDPVVTRCEHYFCSACAIKRFARTPKCAACSAPTAGIFNRADKVIAKLKLKQEAREAEAAGDGDEAGGGGGGVQITGLGDDEDDE